MRHVAQCMTCLQFVVHDPKHLSGCNCDPDASTWVYCEKDGTVKGFSNARWRVISAD